MHDLQIASQPSTLQTPNAGSVRRIELALLFLILLVFSEGILPRLVSSDELAEGSPVLRLLWLPIYAVTGLAVVWKVRALASVCLKLPFLIGLLLICGASFLWSIDPGLTQRRSLAIIMTSLAGLYVGTRYDWRTLLRMFGLVWFTLALTSFLTALLLPGFGRVAEIHTGAWQGLYFEKNQLGGHMARAAVFAGFLWIMDRKFRRAWGGLFFLSSALVLLSTSTTALMGWGMGIGVLALGAWMKRGIRTSLLLFWSVSMFSGGAIAMLVLAPDIVFQWLGRDATLTGRTDIWLVLIEFIQQRPLFGYGYGAFWAPGSEPGNSVRAVLDWDAPTAHNGWLEVTVALGLVGLALLILDFVVTCVRSGLAAIDTWTGLFAVAFCAQFFLFNLSESASLQQNSIVWLLYVAIAAKAANRPKGLVRVKPVRAPGSASQQVSLAMSPEHLARH